MLLGISSQLEHSSPQDWAARHVALGLKSVNFPVSFEEGEEKFMAYKKAADEAGLLIAEVGVWRNTLAADMQERRRWINYLLNHCDCIIPQFLTEIAAITAVPSRTVRSSDNIDAAYRSDSISHP